MKCIEFSFVSYPITNVVKARAFYEGVLGLTVSSVWEGADSAFIEYAIGSDLFVIWSSSKTQLVIKS